MKTLTSITATTAFLLCGAYATMCDASPLPKVDAPVLLVACDSNENVANNCFDEFNNAAKNTFRQEYEGDRARTAGEAVRNCWNCAAETLSDQSRHATDNTTHRLRGGANARGWRLSSLR